jgi:hypothetical protein
VLETVKTRANAGERPDLHFFHDSAGDEVDLVLEHGATLMLVESRPAAWRWTPCVA